MLSRSRWDIWRYKRTLFNLSLLYNVNLAEQPLQWWLLHQLETWSWDVHFLPRAICNQCSRQQQSFWNRFNSLFFYASGEPLKIVYVIFKFKCVAAQYFWDTTEIPAICNLVSLYLHNWNNWIIFHNMWIFFFFG